MTLLEAKYVTLSGSLTVAGMSRQNFDAQRDLCALHLHQETGGVFVTPNGGESFYLSPVAVTSVELIERVNYEGLTRAEAIEGLLHSPDENASSEPDAEAVRVGARNLADEVLAELGEGATALAAQVSDAPKSKRKRK